MIELNQIYNLDCMDFLKQLPDKYVDCFILDPPYFEVINEDWDNQWENINDYLNWCGGWIKEVERVGKLNSTLWIFGFPYQLTKLLSYIEESNFKYRQQIVIWKGLRSIAGRTSKKLKMFPPATESLFYFAYNSIPQIKELLIKKQYERNLTAKEINIALGKASNGGGTWSQIAGPKQLTPIQPTKQDWEKLEILLGKLPPYEDTVFKFNLERGITDVWLDINFYDKEFLKTKIHPTKKPYKLIERIVKSSTNENDIICDFFGGSGTTAFVSKKMNRRFLMCEKDINFFNLSCDRLFKQ